VQVAADVCARGIYLDLTLANWPDNIVWDRSPTKSYFGGQGKLTGTMRRCTNDELIPCPQHPNYTVTVTGTWTVVPDNNQRKRRLLLQIHLNFQEQLWIKPPDPCKDSGKRRSNWDDLYLIPLPPEPPPSPPAPPQDPLDQVMNQIGQNIKSVYGKALKMIYDPPQIIQY
jgi:hypothetical protein